MANQHISDETFDQFQQDLLDRDELEQFLEHTSSCEFCAGRLAECMENEILYAPVNFKENLMKASRRPDIQLKIKAGETSKRMQLFLYSLKVGTATIGALVILMLAISFNSNDMLRGPKDFRPDKIQHTHSLTSVIRENMDHLSTNILDFSNTIMKTEVNENDQKKR